MAFMPLSTRDRALSLRSGRDHDRGARARPASRARAAAIVAHLLGLERTEDGLRWYDAIVASVSGVSAGRPVTDEGAAAFEELRASLVGVLDVQGLSQEEAVSNAAVIMFGGIETTEGMIANAIWHLLSNPGELAAVEADRSLLPNAVE